MTLFAANETISSGWTESTSMTWWSESAGATNGQRLLTDVTNLQRFGHWIRNPFAGHLSELMPCCWP
jgi:hypothetical protein